MDRRNQVSIFLLSLQPISSLISELVIAFIINGLKG